MCWPGVIPCEGGAYIGDPISLRLERADLRNVLGTFSSLTGLEIRVDDCVGPLAISMDVESIPWDLALETVVVANGLTSRLENAVFFVECPK